MLLGMGARRRVKRHNGVHVGSWFVSTRGVKIIVHNELSKMLWAYQNNIWTSDLRGVFYYKENAGPSCYLVNSSLLFSLNSARHWVSFAFCMWCWSLVWLLLKQVRVSGFGGWFLLRLSLHDPVLPLNIEVEESLTQATIKMILLD